MGTLLKGGTVVELEPATVEITDLRVEGSQIVARGQGLTPQAGDEVIDAKGRVLMPGLVSAHHHFYNAFARGMPAPAQPPETFAELLDRTWWRLDQALDLDTCQISATVGAVESLSSGTTTVVDHHSSPRAVTGSLVRVARGLNDVGLRGILSYEVSDRHGALCREEGLEETVSFIRKAKGRFRGLVGAHASFTLSKDALEGLRQAVDATGSGIHIHLAEDPTDERLSLERFGETPVNRLLGAGLLTPKSLVAQAVHLSWPELSTVLSTGSWIVHSPRSNMQNQVGYAPAGKFGARATLGTDGLAADMFHEAKVASLRARDAGQPIDVLRYLANGHRLASQIFDAKIGPLREGAVADLIVLDYRSPTPLTTENLAHHFLFGFESRHVEAAMIDGTWRLWARRPLSVNTDAVHEEARQAAAALWARMAQITSGSSRSFTSARQTPTPPRTLPGPAGEKPSADAAGQDAPVLHAGAAQAEVQLASAEALPSEAQSAEAPALAEGQALASDGYAAEGQALASDGYAAEGQVLASDGYAAEGQAHSSDAYASEGEALSSDAYSAALPADAYVEESPALASEEYAQAEDAQAHGGYAAQAQPVPSEEYAADGGAYAEAPSAEGALEFAPVPSEQGSEVPPSEEEMAPELAQTLVGYSPEPALEEQFALPQPVAPAAVAPPPLPAGPGKGKPAKARPVEARSPPVLLPVEQPAGSANSSEGNEPEGKKKKPRFGAGRSS